MKSRSISQLLLTGLVSFCLLPLAAIENGQPAPDFTLKDSEGASVSLSDFAGKTVVLEWINFGCPFVKKHYQEGHMQALQKKYKDQGVVWLSICSSAPDKQGYFSGEELKAKVTEQKAVPSAYLVDPDGKTGRTYGAKTTPHMYVVDTEGNLVYQGAIDDKRSTDTSDIATSKNYVAEVLDQLLVGEKPESTSTPPYGCSVKYQK